MARTQFLSLKVEPWGPICIARDNLHLLEEGQGMPREELDERIAREEFRRPRESLLNICTEFYKHCGPRLKILQNVAGEPRVTALELLDIKSHMRWCDLFATEFEASFRKFIEKGLSWLYLASCSKD